jgi:carbamoyl-phosphate synthase / aspartate carbamoyltransferase
VPSRATTDDVLGPSFPANLESSKIQAAGVIVATHAGEDYSHYLATSSLATWLTESGVPAIYGIDTRALTKRLRNSGSVLGRLCLAKQAPNGHIHRPQREAKDTLSVWPDDFEKPPFYDPNNENLVAQVSCRQPYICSPPPSIALKHPSGRNIRVLCVDVGLKYNQLRCLVSRHVEVRVVPWDYDFLDHAEEEYDGLFISNGPGDPAMLETTIARIKQALDGARTPIFGICLGHQILALAANGKTRKMKFGNRGQNIPATSMIDPTRCYITSQNHGFEVDGDNLPVHWHQLYVNANDRSNEGVYCENRPYFGTQFHPEAHPGPRDTEFLFTVFIKAITDCLQDPKKLAAPIAFSSAEKIRAPRPPLPKKVLICGSGGVSLL